MENSKKKKQVFKILCPSCQSRLWIDPVTREVIQSEKGKRKKDTLDELLLKEKKKINEFDRKFEATAELEKKKWEEVKKKFEKALTEFDKEGE